MEGILELLNQEDIAIEEALSGEVVDGDGNPIKKENKFVKFVKGVGEKIWNALKAAWAKIVEKFTKLRNWLKKFAFWKKKKEQEGNSGGAQNVSTDNTPRISRQGVKLAALPEKGTATQEERERAQRNVNRAARIGKKMAQNEANGSKQAIPMGGAVNRGGGKGTAPSKVEKKAKAQVAAYTSRDNSNKRVLNPEPATNLVKKYLSEFSKYTILFKNGPEQLMNKAPSLEAQYKKCNMLKEQCQNIIDQTFADDAYMDAKAAEAAADHINGVISTAESLSKATEDIANGYLKNAQMAVDATKQKGAHKAAEQKRDNMSSYISAYQSASRDMLSVLGKLYSGYARFVKSVSGAQEALMYMDEDYAMECGYYWVVDEDSMDEVATESMNALYDLEFDIDDSDADEDLAM